MGHTHRALTSVKLGMQWASCNLKLLRKSTSAPDSGPSCCMYGRQAVKLDPPPRTCLPRQHTLEHDAALTSGICKYPCGSKSPASVPACRRSSAQNESSCWGIKAKSKAAALPARIVAPFCFVQHHEACLFSKPHHRSFVTVDSAAKHFPGTVFL